MRIISGIFKNRVLFSPKGATVRPTSEQVRGAIFNIIGDNIIDTLFLDLFAGSGAMGFEAISRGAKRVTFIEKDKNALATLKKNIDTLQVDSKTTLFAQNSLSMVPKLISKRDQFDIIFMDPPYDESKIYEELLTLIANSSLLSPKGVLIVEERESKRSPSYSLPHLALIDERTYGSTKIKFYQKIDLLHH